MKKFFPKLLLLTILLLIFPAASFAEVSNIIFATDPQSIKPNTLSGPITIQTQDSNGNAFQTPETLDIQYISTSGTGQFLGSTGNLAVTYMSKNTANKTFYYKDSASGTFTITVNMRGRDSGIELDASQQITISSSAVQSSPDTSSDASGEVLGASSNSSSPNLSFMGGSTAKVSSLNSQLEILAGSDRTTAPGSTIWFQATLKKNTTSISPELNWSFGDGNVGMGPLISHSYKYPGDYAVVLNARAGDIFSVSRLKVKVAEPNISISDRGEYLEISNNSGIEINLFNWKIEDKGKGFVFQPDTILLPHSSMKLDKALLNMKGLDNSPGISLKNCLNQEIFSIAPVQEVNLGEISKNLSNIRQQALAIQSKMTNPAIGIGKIGTDPASLLVATTSADNIIYETPKPEGFISKLTNFIKRVFFK